MKKYMILGLAVAAAFCGAATESDAPGNDTKLSKQVTLKRQFNPVKRKAVKKHTTPKTVSRKPGNGSNGDSIAPPQYSFSAVPVDIETNIPVMEPYGYKTLHNFSHQKGYLDITAGTQLNLGVSAGLRAIDNEKAKLDIWLQHNSTWLGKNTTTLIDNDIKQKQRYNDNLIGAKWRSGVAGGALDAQAALQFDSYNYYGSFTTNDYLNNDKQSFFNIDLGAKWRNERPSESAFSFGGLNARLVFSGYGKSLIKGIGGAKEFWFNAGGDAAYDFSDNMGVSLNATLDVMNMARKNVFNNTVNSTMGMLTFLPQFSYHTDNNRFHFEGGLNINLSFNDGAFLRLAPVAHAAFTFTDGVSAVLDATGGKTLNHLATLHAATRYADPMARYGNSYTPLDLKVGINLGGFKGFAAKLWMGYEYARKSLDICLPVLRNLPEVYDYSELLYVDDPSLRFASAHFIDSNYSGFTMGIDLSYKYRSLVEANLNYKHSFSGIKVHDDGRYNGGATDGIDGAANVLTLDVKVRPIAPLTIEAGFDWRGDRSVLASINPVVNPDATKMGYYFNCFELDDVLNLRLRAGYSFNSVVTLWAQINNILSKQWDVLPGMGAQKLCVMGGVGFTF